MKTLTLRPVKCRFSATRRTQSDRCTAVGLPRGTFHTFDVARPWISHTISKRSPFCLKISAVEASDMAEIEDEGEEGDVLELGMRTLPRAKEFQQTLMRSFTLGGIGLHSGEYAWVRVRPAVAGEGRYFVRVPEGTNKHLFVMEEDSEPFDFSVADQATPPELEEKRIELYKMYQEARDRGNFEGNFSAFAEELARPVKGDPDPYAEETEPFEDVIPRSATDNSISANLASAHTLDEHCTILGDEDNYIMSVEHLLSALEACGVDNARIEIEGGIEVPALDGSALGWVLEIQQAGLRPAPFLVEQGEDEGEEDADDSEEDKVAAEGEVVAEDDDVEEFQAEEDEEISEDEVNYLNEALATQLIPRLARRFPEVITVKDGDSFISYYPEDSFRLTVGIDHTSEAVVIGRQWYTFCLDEDTHYRFDIAPARTYITSVEQAYELRGEGYLRAGTENCVLVAFGERWYNSQLVRFSEDEPVRHKVQDLIGDLSLLASSGNAGIPLGHIVAYKPNHRLQLLFCQAMEESRKVSDDWVSFLQIEEEDQSDDGEAFSGYVTADGKLLDEEENEMKFGADEGDEGEQDALVDELLSSQEEGEEEAEGGSFKREP